MSIQQFLDELASKTPTPGGGSVAAICGAMGAALISMVAHYTIGKKGYEDVQDEIQKSLSTAEVLRHKLTAAIKDDIDVFNRVMTAYGMPKETDQEKEMRSVEIQSALKVATDVPLESARLCRDVITLSESIATKGNQNVISDAGVAVEAGYAGLRSSALNVYINIAAIKDQAFVEDRQQKLESLLDGMETLKEEVYDLVRKKLQGTQS